MILSRVTSWIVLITILWIVVPDLFSQELLVEPQGVSLSTVYETPWFDGYGGHIGLVPYAGGYLSHKYVSDQSVLFHSDSDFKLIWQFPTVGEVRQLGIFGLRVVSDSVLILYATEGTTRVIRKWYELKNGELVGSDYLYYNSENLLVVNSIILSDELMVTGGSSNLPNSQKKRLYVDVANQRDSTANLIATHSDTNARWSALQGLAISGDTAVLSYFCEFTPGRSVVGIGQFSTKNPKNYNEILVGDSTRYQYLNSSLIIPTGQEYVFVTSVSWDRYAALSGWTVWKYSLESKSVVDSAQYLWSKSLSVFPYKLYPSKSGFYAVGEIRDYKTIGVTTWDSTKRGLVMKFDINGRLEWTRTLGALRPTSISSISEQDQGLLVACKNDSGVSFAGYIDYPTSVESDCLSCAEEMECCDLVEVTWNCSDYLGRRVDSNETGHVFCIAQCRHGKLYRKKR